MPSPLLTRNTTILLALALAALSAALIALVFGPIPLQVVDVFRALLLPWRDDQDSLTASLVWDLRAPRALLALIVGAALATAGAAMQGLFRNPLADPGLVGVASGSALAAVTMMVAAAMQTLPAVVVPYAVPVAAFCGGLLAAWLAARLASERGETRTATLLLAGLAINAVAGAGIGLLVLWADEAALRNAWFWLFGSLGKAGWTELVICGPILLAIVLWLPREAPALNALLLGESEAGHLGVEVENFKRRILLLVVLAVALCVALAGLIGFVGLIVPHLLRLLLGPDHRLILPASAFGGATLLVLADLASRTVLSPAEIPVGILTALIGGPFFLALLVRLRGRIEAW